MSVGIQEFRDRVENSIEDFISELLDSDDHIAAFALEHIHSNEIILTHSCSASVLKFLIKAAEERTFTVIHAVSYPNSYGDAKIEGGDEISLHEFQQPLTKRGITFIVLTDAAVFAVMSRVNKVILGAHAVISTGGLVAAAGARIIAQAARKHRVPVIVLSGLYKLSCEYPFEFDSLIEYGDTGKILDYSDGKLVDSLDVDNPLFDYVPPELVDLYITNQ
jgi:translation initiation factor eIF-2B subunit beta